MLRRRKDNQKSTSNEVLLLKKLMTFPVYLHLGSFSISAHLIFDILAYSIGFAYYSALQKKKGFLSEDQSFFILVGAAAGALIGSRFLGALEDPQAFIHPTNLLYYYSGSTIVGGILGAIIGVEIAKWFMKIKKSTGGIITFPLIIAMCIGRIGCLLTGVSDHTAGNPSSLPWAFDQGDGIRRHPTSLYEILFLLILFFVLRAARKKGLLSDGILFRLFVIFYLIFRFLIEFIKPMNPLFAGLSAIQIASIMGALYYIVRIGIARLRRTRYNLGIT
jgi:phosphatidylglycerol:prolipoprotein diacylglycerol transferase